MGKDIKVGILAIGDEVVLGQITNRNAAWLATELLKENLNTTHHLSCRDTAEDIAESLNFLSQHCSFILVSGGLGPTKDDCTR
ncbi:MAG: molybdopterin-binding protein, partial [Bdellovibrionales bacterium]|nr:molybdopterin-binding protein [Bdellovibrionales bacterium]